MKEKDIMSGWRIHIAKQVESGLSKPAYCRKHGLRIHQFYYYSRKLGDGLSKDSGFARVVVSQPVEANREAQEIRLFIGRDLCLAMDAGRNSVWVAGLIKELRGPQ